MSDLEQVIVRSVVSRHPRTRLSAESSRPPGATTSLFHCSDKEFYFLDLCIETDLFRKPGICYFPFLVDRHLIFCSV